jgi:hypothetical protein
VRAFVASRVLVLAAGAIGVLSTAKHDSTAAAKAAHQLGPLGNVLAGSVDRFDAGYYLSIAEHGYGTLASGTPAFFPLYPLLIRGLSFFSGSDVLAGAIISSAAFAAALVMLHRLTRLELGSRAADVTVMLFAFAPLSFFFSAVYTESLFLMLSVGSLLAARVGRWRLACLLGTLATLTRPTGLLIAIPLAVMRIRRQGGLDRGLMWVAALPAALAGYLALLAASGYPLLAPFLAQAKWARVTVGPVIGLAEAIRFGVSGAVHVAGGAAFYRPTLIGPFTLGGESIVLLFLLALTLWALVQCLRRLPLEYGLYSAAVILMCLSTPWEAQPLWSFDRFTLTIFPLWMAVGAWLARRRLVVPVVVIGSLMLVFYTVQFSSWAFVA